jgi:hypothetical protein
MTNVYNPLNGNYYEENTMADNCVNAQQKVCTLKVENHNEQFPRIILRLDNGFKVNSLKLTLLSYPHIELVEASKNAREYWVRFNDEVYGVCDITTNHVIHLLNVLQDCQSPLFLADNLDTKQIKSRLFDCELTHIKLSLYSSGKIRKWSYPPLTMSDQVMVSIEHDIDLTVGVWLQGPHMSAENKAKVFEKYSRTFYNLGGFPQIHYFDNDTILFTFPTQGLEFVTTLYDAMSSISQCLTTEYSYTYQGPRIGNKPQSLDNDDFVLEDEDDGFVNFYFQSFT